MLSGIFDCVEQFAKNKSATMAKVAEISFFIFKNFHLQFHICAMNFSKFDGFSPQKI